MLRDFGSLNFCMHSTSGEVERVKGIKMYELQNQYNTEMQRFITNYATRKELDLRMLSFD